MPIRKDIEVFPADNPKDLRLGFIIYEELGPIGCSKDIWDSMSEEGKTKWNEMNREIINKNKQAREKWMKETGIAEDDIKPID